MAVQYREVLKTEKTLNLDTRSKRWLSNTEKVSLPCRSSYVQNSIVNMIFRGFTKNRGQLPDGDIRSEYEIVNLRVDTRRLGLEFL